MKGRKPAALKVVADNKPRMSDSGELPALPSYLPEEMRTEWNITIQSLSDRRLLDNDILPAVECYILAIWNQRDALKVIQEQGRTFKLKSGEIKKNPAVSDLKAAQDDIIRVAVELGLTPSSKSRKGMGGGEPIPTQTDPDEGTDDGTPPGLDV